MAAITRAMRMTRTRAIVVALAILGLVVICITRLASIQVVQADELNAQADGRRAVSLALNGTRGDIVDINGTVLAGTVDRWDLAISPKLAQDLVPPTYSVDRTITIGELLTQIAEITGEDANDLQTLLNTERSQNPESDYMVLVRGMDLAVYQEVAALIADYGAGFLTLQLNPQRIYPQGAVAGNLLGFMGTDSALAGLELSQNACLAAQPGDQSFDRAADGTPIPGTVVTNPAVDGGTLQLTIDADVQYEAQQIAAQYTEQLQAQHGTVIVMRTDGTLVAVGEAPTVDPNVPTATDQQFQGSWAFTHAFEPGSIFKTMAMAAMLDLGLVAPTDALTVPSRYDPAGPVRVTDAEYHPTMQWTATGAFVNSSNVGMVQMGEDLSRADYFDYLSDFGYGETTAIDFLGEQSAGLADPNNLDQQTSLNVLFGQGIAVTPIQVVSAYQAIANGGVHSGASLVAECTMPDGTVVTPDVGPDEQVIAPETATTLLDMMEHVVTDYGNEQFAIEGYRVAAKTGTAELVLPGTVGYSPTERIITTAGVFPVDDPQFIVYTQFDLPQTQRTSAGAIPAFHDMVNLLIRHFDIPPSTGTESDLPITWD